jgi:hypothetical protein
LTRQMRPTVRTAIAVAALIGLGAPSTIAFTSIARTALDAQIVPTPRGNVAFPRNEGVTALFQNIAAIPSGDAFFFYPYMPMMPFLVSREHVSKYDIFIPGYTTPAQYRDACLSVVRHASWVVIDQRFANYNHWKQAFPSMPDAEPQEAIRFERALDRALEPAAIKGFFDLRHRRKDISDDICKDIAEGVY